MIYGISPTNNSKEISHLWLRIELLTLPCVCCLVILWSFHTLLKASYNSLRPQTSNLLFSLSHHPHLSSVFPLAFDWLQNIGGDYNLYIKYCYNLSPALKLMKAMDHYSYFHEIRKSDSNLTIYLLGNCSL